VIEVPPLLTANLSLEPLLPATLEALLAGDVDAASLAQGLSLPAAFAESAEEFFLRVQLERMAANPAGRGWCARAIVGLGDGAVVGHAGFHGPPEDVGRAEIGYTVLPAYRGRGYATEAAAALVAYAQAQGLSVVFATVAPGNAPSLRVVAKLGFVQTGVQIDEVDGEELVFELALVGGPTKGTP
jgi:ribosomal-protein-alanine N-acetyltransferase